MLKVEEREAEIVAFGRENGVNVCRELNKLNKKEMREALKDESWESCQFLGSCRYG